MSTATLHSEKKKALVPILRFQEFEENWVKFKIKNLTNVVSGGTPSTLKKEFWGGSIPWMNSGELNLKIVYDVKNRITELGLNKSSTKIIPENSILIGLAGQGKTRGTAAMNMIELCINQSIAAILPNEEKFNSRFLYLNIDSRYDELRNLSTGDGGRGGLNLQIIKSFNVTIPTLPEQQKIASFLSAVDEKIQQLSRKKELLAQYKKGVMQQLFSGKLRFKDENGEDYQEWEEKKLGDFCTFFSGGTPTSTNQKFYSGTIPFIGSGNIYDSEVFSFISEKALNSSSAKIVEKGDLLYALYGANSGELAISKIKGAINQAILCIRNQESIEYLYYVLLLNKDNIVAKFLQGGQGNLSAQIIKQLKYKFPSIKEQQKIADFLSSIDVKIESTSQQINQTQSFKKGLLQQLFV